MVLKFKEVNFLVLEYTYFYRENSESKLLSFRLIFYIG